MLAAQRRRASSIDAVHALRGRVDGALVNAGAYSHTQPRDPRRARRRVGAVRRSPPHQHLRARAGAPPLDARAGGDRRCLSASAPTATSSRCAASSRRFTARARELIHAPRRLAALVDGAHRGAPRRAAAHEPAEHPVPHRILRLERAARRHASATSCSSPTSATRRRSRTKWATSRASSSSRRACGPGSGSSSRSCADVEVARVRVGAPAAPRLPAAARGGRALAVAPARSTSSRRCASAKDADEVALIARRRSVATTRARAHAAAGSRRA